MTETELLKLKEENQRFRQLAEEDRLTELYNRGTAEEKINAQLTKYQEGVLLVIDIDHFKKINDRYGHLIGDDLLREIAVHLKAMFLKSDIIGRVGGDEFVVFLSVKQHEEFAEERAKQVKQQLRKFEVRTCLLDITISVGYSVYQEGDNYRGLFDRADQRLIEKKQQRGKNDPCNGREGRGLEMDVLRIQNELKEYATPKGAYFLDYNTFKRLYRFVERRLQRLDTRAYVVLMTLTDGEKNLLPLDENLKWMEILKETICEQLRAGDVFTQYSSGQYMIMLADVWGDESEAVASRVKEAFYSKSDGARRGFLLHHCFPMNGACVRCK